MLEATVTFCMPYEIPHWHCCKLHRYAALYDTSTTTTDCMILANLHQQSVIMQGPSVLAEHSSWASSRQNVPVVWREYQHLRMPQCSRRGILSPCAIHICRLPLISPNSEKLYQSTQPTAGRTPYPNRVHVAAALCPGYYHMVLLCNSYSRLPDTRPKAPCAVNGLHVLRRGGCQRN